MFNVAKVVNGIWKVAPENFIFGLVDTLSLATQKSVMKYIGILFSALSIAVL